MYTGTNGITNQTQFVAVKPFMPSMNFDIYTMYYVSNHLILY